MEIHVLDVLKTVLAIKQSKLLSCSRQPISLFGSDRLSAFATNNKEPPKASVPKWHNITIDDDDDEGRINFSVALSPKTTRTRNNKLKQWIKSRNSSQRNETFLVMSVRPGKKFGFQSAAENLQRRRW